MKKELKGYEKAIKNVFKKSLNRSPLSAEDLQLIELIRKTRFYLEVRDGTEGTQFLKIFTELFLTAEHRRKTMVALSIETGYNERTLIRHKKKVLQIFAFIKQITGKK